MEPIPAWLLATLLTVPVDGRPVRFGVALPASEVAQGLRLVGAGTMQWRRLPIGGPAADPVWVEIAIVGAEGTARIVAGGAPPCPDGRGPAFVRERECVSGPSATVTTTRWRWLDGTVDERVRTSFMQAATVGGETFGAGEATTTWSADPALRASPVLAIARRVHEASGLLPPAGRLADPVRRRLREAAQQLPELPGVRGAGDFARSGGVVTNLEFDTPLALVRCAVAFRDPRSFALAARCARHLVDRDLDRRTGLPFPHGPDHRTGMPEPGHAWAQGLRWVGLLTADDDLLAAADGIVAALASHPPAGEGRDERARDYAWPLAELEEALALAGGEAPANLVAAADRLAAAIDLRFDAAARTYRFGEGEVGDGVYFERGWITGGIVVPAMQRHLRRSPDPARTRRLAVVRRGLLDRVGLARGGLPTHWRIARGETFAEHRTESAPTAALMLEAFEPADLRRLLGREEMRAMLSSLPEHDDPDLATSFTLMARCRWTWR